MIHIKITRIIRISRNAGKTIGKNRAKLTRHSILILLTVVKFSQQERFRKVSGI